MDIINTYGQLPVGLKVQLVRVLHRYRRGHVFESRSSLDLFQVLSISINCDGRGNSYVWLKEALHNREQSPVLFHRDQFSDHFSSSFRSMIFLRALSSRPHVCLQTIQPLRPPVDQ